MNKPPQCNGCALAGHSKGFSHARGEALQAVMFAGHTLDKHSESEGTVCSKHSEGGSLLTHTIESRLKRGMEEFKWDSVIKCFPPEKTQLSQIESASQQCKVYNSRSFDDPSVKVIIALGQEVFTSLTGIYGKKQTIDDLRGYVFKVGDKLVLPTFDPKLIRRGNANLTGALIHDIKKAIAIGQEQYTSYESHSDFTPPKLEITDKLSSLVGLFYRLKENQNLTLFYDIENPYSKDINEDEKEELESSITSIQFATDKHWAITVPWDKPFIKVALAILALGNEKVAFNNWVHDDPRLRKNDAQINGVIHDGMWAWHHLQPGLDKALQRCVSYFDMPYAWKHLAFEDGQEDTYGGSDVIALAYLWEKLPTRMKQMGVWESYLKFKVRYHQKVLVPCQVRGFPVDEEKRLQLVSHVETEIAREDNILQKSVSSDLRNIKPKEGYKREPKIISEHRIEYTRAIERMQARGISTENIRSFEQWAESRTGLTFRDFGTVDGDFQQALEFDLPDDEWGDGSDGIGDDERIWRWCRLEPFKASSDQLIRYMEDKGIPVPRSVKKTKDGGKEERDTTGKKELIEVWEKCGDPVLESSIKIRSLGKMLSNDLPNWKPAKDGSVHTTFKFDPPSFQLSSSSPNIQNAKKHEPDSISKILGLGKKFRGIVKAPPGRCIVEFDKKSFHVAMMGFQARDPLYLKWAKIDMHSVVTSYIVGQPISLSLSESDAKLAVKEIKKHFKIIRDTQGKPTVLGNQLGLGAQKLWQTNKTYVDEAGVRQEGIRSRKEAERLQELLAGMFPKTHLYKKRIKEEAHYRGYLRSLHGALRHFFDVMRWDYRARGFKNGSEAEEAQSHNLQSDAFGMIHSEILDMGENSEILEEHWFANTVHDSVIMIPEIGKRDRCIEEVYGFMNKPDGVLVDQTMCPNGLSIGVDVSVSPEAGCWNELQEIAI